MPGEEVNCFTLVGNYQITLCLAKKSCNSESATGGSHGREDAVEEALVAPLSFGSTLLLTEIIDALVPNLLSHIKRNRMTSIEKVKTVLVPAIKVEVFTKLILLVLIDILSGVVNALGYPRQLVIANIFLLEVLL
ncbi:hypothetical protein PanWU01x14_199050 [Parasponia andersonii]|uniref:Uncharacterized protein n=1 Tax=Parasponia andersonii TaxID=3476 RepID=A0A2P5BYM5_PARAD|nr:hypothetical protein PanWU01x14_199050 [Parasponia andersonii]